MLPSKKTRATLSGIAQRISVLLIAGLAALLVGATLAAAFGYLPWLGLDVRFGAEVLDLGLYAQIFFTALAVTLLFFLPSHGRMMQLENSHRKFHLSMQDVAQAYRLAHEADREQLFKTGAEFDEVRERIAHLRNHPDLVGLEPEILEIASQMSFESRDLAQVYSKERVDRARLFLRQRHEEMEEFRQNLKLARTSVDELKHWLTQVEADELTVSKQVDALEADLNALLPKLGFEVLEAPTPERTVVPMSTPKPAKGKASRDERPHPGRPARRNGTSRPAARPNGTARKEVELPVDLEL